MIASILKTDRAEAVDLGAVSLGTSIFFFGILPAVAVAWVRLPSAPIRRAAAQRLRGITVGLLLAAITIASFGKFYASYLREHKNLRPYVNPLYAIYSAGKYASRNLGESNGPLRAIGLESYVPATDLDRELVILVVGETARADHFSLNGYARETNPRLRRESVLNFSDVWACGTSTAVSVPCMFSAYGRAEYTERQTRSTENLLDVLTHTKHVNVLWRDNNSDSKGVAVRVPNEDFKTSARNPRCDGECRDLGMLHGLQEYIDRQKDDVFIVLHQMGNHGPAYYKRYPQEFEKFRPACRTNELEACSREEIVNAYDNAILYTDHFLAEVISLLKRNTTKFETAMIYVSDHGESLGEKGAYLHGLPYLIAPDEQKKVPLIVWLGESLRGKLDEADLARVQSARLSHDNLFHTVLGLFEVKTTLYHRELDLLKRAPPQGEALTMTKPRGRLWI